MYNLTCSFHKGTCASSHLGHNNRTIFVPHADPKRKHLNVCYMDMTVEEALQKKNQEIKIQAKQIITDGQTIGDKLRNKDLDMIEQSLMK